jgi:hypothetical protein
MMQEKNMETNHPQKRYDKKRMEDRKGKKGVKGKGNGKFILDEPRGESFFLGFT